MSVGFELKRRRSTCRLGRRRRQTSSFDDAVFEHGFAGGSADWIRTNVKLILTGRKRTRFLPPHRRFANFHDDLLCARGHPELEDVFAAGAEGDLRGQEERRCPMIVTKLDFSARIYPHEQEITGQRTSRCQKRKRTSFHF